MADSGRRQTVRFEQNAATPGIGEQLALGPCGRKLTMPAYDSALETPPQPLDEFVREHGCSDGIDFQSLPPGTVVHVDTRFSTYRLVVVHPDDKRATVTGGRFFPEPTELRIEGATAGGTAIKAGWIGVGLRLEMSALSNRITTSVVRSVTVDPPPYF
jgi:hypothetical protein